MFLSPVTYAEKFVWTDQGMHAVRNMATATEAVIDPVSPETVPKMNQEIDGD